MGNEIPGVRSKEVGLGRPMSSANEEFERLVAAYERRIYNVALKLAGDADEAAELTQDTFLRAFKAWANFRREAQAYTWLYRILVNLNKDRIARQVRRREREGSLSGGTSGEQALELPDKGPSPLDESERGELRDVLMNAIDELPQGYKECVVLKDMEGLSYDEIAQAMGITTEAVRSRLARARQQLRQHLAPHLQA